MTEAEPGIQGGPRTLTADSVRWLVATASRAPSLHNSQPWQFRYCDGSLELWADRRRWPRFADPSGRELLISCGAALLTLRVAARSLGHEVAVHLLPDRGSPDLLARVGAGAQAPVRPSDIALLRAVHRRHTHRGPFSTRPVAAPLRAALQRSAEQHGAALTLLDDPGRRAVAARVAGPGAKVQRARPLVAAEARRWAAVEGSRDGVRPESRTAAPPFGLAARPPAAPAGASTRGSHADGSVLAVLTTAADRPADWLRAGQALQHVLLLAATDWVFADIDSQALEVEQLRRQLAHDLHLPGAPQLVLALGHAPVAPLTPRRPVAAVLAGTGGVLDAPTP